MIQVLYSSFHVLMPTHQWIQKVSLALVILFCTTFEVLIGLSRSTLVSTNMYAQTQPSAAPCSTAWGIVRKFLQQVAHDCGRHHLFPEHDAEPSVNLNNTHC